MINRKELYLSIIKSPKGNFDRNYNKYKGTDRGYFLYFAIV